MRQYRGDFQPAVATQRDCVHYSGGAGVDGLEVMRARWVERAFAPHMHDFFAVSLNDGGVGAFECRRAAYRASPGTCNLIGPGELHTGRATSGDGWSYRNLHIEPALMTRLLQGCDWRGSGDVAFKTALVNDAVLARRLARVFDSMKQSRSLLERESRLLSVAARLITTHLVRGHDLGGGGSEHAAVGRVKDWLDAHIEQNVSIRSLAGLVNLSPHYLVRVFHRHVGIPPHRYHANVRVNRARALIGAGADLSQAAYRAGFCDQSHLTRSFKSTLGVTPGAYAAECGKSRRRAVLIPSSQRPAGSPRAGSPRRSLAAGG